MTHYSHYAFLLLAALCLPATAVTADKGNPPKVWLPDHRLTAAQIAVIVNDADPLSVRIANYYLQARKIPSRNLIHVRFKPGIRQMPTTTFTNLQKQVLKQLNQSIQAIALTWALPYRVGCMSITSAFAFGFDKAYCSKKTCATTRHSLYYDSPSITPFSTYKMRPTIAIAAQNFAQAKQLIDRGIAADNSQPTGTAYLLNTSDKNRSVRAVWFGKIQQFFQTSLNVEVIQSDSIQNKHDVLFYFTGLTKVPHLNTLNFLPGAIADHLTSVGGKLDGTSQMSSLRWLEAGASGSFGTVVEPCNLLEKFPNPGILMDHYMSGTTLIEAYWKSVKQPGEGLFIGEPLAAPFDGVTIEENNTHVILKTKTLRPGIYKLLISHNPIGPYETWPQPLVVKPRQHRIMLPKTKQRFYKIERTEK